MSDTILAKDLTHCLLKAQDERTIAACATALTSLSTFPQNQRTMITSGVVIRLLELSRVAQPAPTRLLALRLLANISQAALTQLLHMRAIKLLLAIVRESHNDVLRKEACRALWNLSDNPAAVQRILQNNGAQVLTQFAASQAVECRFYALATLVFIARSSNTGAHNVVAQGGITHLVSTLRMNNVMLEKYALGALLYLTQEKTHLQKLSQQEEVVQLLCQVLRRDVGGVAGPQQALVCIVLQQATQLLTRLASLTGMVHSILSAGAVPLLLRKVALQGDGKVAQARHVQILVHRSIRALHLLSQDPDARVLIGFSGGIPLCMQYLRITCRTADDTVLALELLHHVALHATHRQTVVNAGALVLGWNAVGNARDERVKRAAAQLVDELLQTPKAKGLLQAMRCNWRRLMGSSQSSLTRSNSD